MSYCRRAVQAGGCFFFTVVTYRRRPWLVDEVARAALRKAIICTREKHPFTIDAWVLLPDHLHCIWTLPPGDSDFSKRWSLIKRRVSMALGESLYVEAWMSSSKVRHRESTLWQRRYLWPLCPPASSRHMPGTGAGGVLSRGGQSFAWLVPDVPPAQRGTARSAD